MNQSATFQTGLEHDEREMTSNDGNPSHRRPGAIRHSRESSQSRSIGSFLGDFFRSLRTASRIPGPLLHPAPASVRNPAYAQKEKPQREQNTLGPTPVESNEGHHVQAGERGPFRQAGTEILQIMKQKDAEIHDLQAERAQRVQQHEKHMEHMRASCTVAIQQKDACILQLRQDNKSLERDLMGLSGECSRLQSVALTAQAGALRAMEKRGWAAKEDRVVRDELTKLQDGLRSWAKKYSRATVNSDFEGVSGQQKDKIVLELKGYCVQTNWHSLMERMPISSNKVPLVLVQALLAKDIFQNIFADPFFAFPEIANDPSLPGRPEMQLLYRTIMQSNQAEAHIWRSQMIQVLSTPPADSSGKGPLMPDRLQRMANAYTKEFTNGSAQMFLREPENKADVTRRSDDLHRLYHQAGELSLSLWAQRTFIESHSRQRLQEFNSSSPLMMAHRLHHLDEDDKRLDGREILLCIQPAVLAFGNENGEDYDKRKVWAKAVVLVDI